MSCISSRNNGVRNVPKETHGKEQVLFLPLKKQTNKKNEIPKQPLVFVDRTHDIFENILTRTSDRFEEVHLFVYVQKVGII